MSENNVSTQAGCSAPFLVGAVISSGLSYRLNESALWAVLHFFLNWIYLAWCLVARTEDLVSLFHRIVG